MELWIWLCGVVFIVASVGGVFLYTCRNEDHHDPKGNHVA